MTSGANVDAIAGATERTWADWVALLDSHGARELPHPDIAALAAERMPQGLRNPGWWAQGVAVAYEQHIGRRVPGQRADGTFEVSVTKTLPGGLDAVAARWHAAVEGLDAFDGVAFSSRPRSSATEKWRRWRVDLEDGTKVGVDVGRKGPESSTLALTCGKLHSPADIERWRAYFRPFLDAVA